MKILILKLVFAFSMSGQIQSISPSIFYTYGDYSNGNSSGSVAAYGTIGINDYDFISIGFENINIDNSLWTYGQYNLSAGVTKNFYPFYLNANYMFVNGNFDLKDVNLKQKDFLNIYNIGLTYNYDKLFLSSNFSYLDLNGYKSTILRQYEIEISLLASEYVTIALGPTHSNVADGRSLYSFSGTINYHVSGNLTIKFSSFIGERAYYFNNKLFTLFNQDETQKSLYELKLQYFITNTIQLSSAFQRSKFRAYDINYYIIGLKTFF